MAGGLSDDLSPYDDPAARALLGSAWLALTRDVACSHPRLVREVDWERLDRGWRIVWVAHLLRIARAWTEIDLTDELTREWAARERAVLAVWLAETKVTRAWGRFYTSPTAEHRSALDAELEAQAALARETDAEVASTIESRFARSACTPCHKPLRKAGDPGKERPNSCHSCFP